MIEKFEERKGIIIPTEKEMDVEEAIYNYNNPLSFFEKVKNKVIFANLEVNIPLKLEEGKESPLGLFFKTAISKEHIEKQDGQELETWPEHLRSALLGRVIFGDKEGRIYRDIEIKGSGSISKKQWQKTGKVRESESELEYYGLLESKDAFKEHKISEELLSKGIRTHRVLAIINLEEIIIEGEKISLEEAQKRGIIPETFQPVIEVRGFGTKARIRDFISTEWPQEIRKLILEDAKELVSQETGKDLSQDEDYLEWFAKTLGQNLGLLHKNGYFHSNLKDGHNTTLDCRIVDLDTVEKFIFNEKWRLSEDKNDAMISFSIFVDQLLYLKEGMSRKIIDGLFGQFKKNFEESYDAVFSPEEREKFFENLKKDNLC